MHPIIPSKAQQEEKEGLKIADCTACRLWGGIVHVGFAAFVASNIKEMQSRGAKGFLIAFSSGNTLYASNASPATSNQNPG